MTTLKFELDTDFQTDLLLTTDPKTDRTKKLKGKPFQKYLDENAVESYVFKVVQCNPDKDGDVGPYLEFSSKDAVGECEIHVNPNENFEGFAVRAKGVFQIEVDGWEETHLGQLAEDGVDMEFRVMQIQLGEFWYSDRALLAGFKELEPAKSEFQTLPLVNIIK